MRSDLKTINVSEWLDWSWKLKLGLITISCILLLIISYFLSLEEQWTMFDKTKQRLWQMEHEHMEYQHQLKQLTTQQRELSKLQTLFKEKQKQLLGESQQIILLDELSKLGQINHLNIKQIKPLEERKENYFLIKTLRITAMANYHQVGQFISQLTALNLLVIPTDFSLQRFNKVSGEVNNLDAHQDNDKLLLTILLKVYCKKR